MIARGFAGPWKNFSAPGESSRLAMHCTAAGAGRSLSSRMMVSGWPMPVRPQAPINPSATSFSNTGRTWADEHRIGRHAAAGVAPFRRERRVRHDVGVQEEQVQPGQAQALQAALDRAAQGCLDLAGRRIAQIALAGDADAGGQAAAERLADDLFGLAVAVARRQVEQGDPGFDRGVDRGDAFVEGGRRPTACRDRRRRGLGWILVRGRRMSVVAWFWASVPEDARVGCGVTHGIVACGAATMAPPLQFGTAPIQAELRIE